MFGIGQPELIIVVFILLLFFGPSSLPKLSRTLGDSIRSLREGFTDGKNDKTFKDITQEFTTSAREIKQGLADVKSTVSLNPTPVNETPGGGPAQPAAGGSPDHTPDPRGHIRRVR